MDSAKGSTARLEEQEDQVSNANSIKLVHLRLWMNAPDKLRGESEQIEVVAPIPSLWSYSSPPLIKSSPIDLVNPIQNRILQLDNNRLFQSL